MIGCGAYTDVASLMIFVTIKLIVVYGSEMQECSGGRAEKAEVGRRGCKRAEGLADCKLNVVETVAGCYKRDGDRGFVCSLSYKGGLAHTVNHLQNFKVMSKD